MNQWYIDKITHLVHNNCLLNTTNFFTQNQVIWLGTTFLISQFYLILMCKCSHKLNDYMIYNLLKLDNCFNLVIIKCIATLNTMSIIYKQLYKLNILYLLLHVSYGFHCEYKII